MPLFSHKKKHTAEPIGAPVMDSNLNGTNPIPGATTDHHRVLQRAPRRSLDPALQPEQVNNGYQSHMPSGATAGGLGNGIGDELPPANVLNHSNQSRSGHSLSGKIERTVGSLVGSESLKARGLQKEQEASAYKIQAAELAEAERLEREALLRRERAVAHGAHPDNKHHGAGFSEGGTGGVSKSY